MREGRHRYIILFLAACVLLFLGASASYAMDPPHVGPSFGCDACHSNDILNTSGATIDETPYNLMCATTPGCHITSMATHSIIETGSTARSTAWTYECRNCHNPHYQKQYWANQADYPAGAKLQKGKIVSITDNTIQVTDMGDTDPGWQADKWAGYLFQPNKDEPYLYEITGNTNNTLTTVSNVVTTYYGWVIAGPGHEFGIANTSLIRDEIYTKFPVVNATGGMVENTKYRPVKFLNATGSDGSLGASASDYQAVCVVCHTRTKANNYGFAVHPNEHSFNRADTGLFEYAEYQGAYSHTGEYESTDQKCFDNGNSACHTGHDEGYARGGADCGSCHGGTAQMTSDTHLVKKLIDGGGGEVITYTGGHIWAHPKHMEKGLSCDDCHDKAKGGMNPGTNDVPIGDYSIFMSFGSYDGAGALYRGRPPADLLNGFTYNGPASPTQSMSPNTVTNNNYQCRNVYCHSDGGNFAGTITYPPTYPEWNVPFAAEPTCNKCHGDSAGSANDQTNYVSTNLHDKHTDVAAGSYGYTCNKCHDTVVDSQNAVINNSLHVNGGKNVSFSAGGTWTRDPNGTCSVYCHSDTFGGYQTANWDGSTGSLDCGGCHNKAGDASPTWSFPHTEHVNTTTYGDAARSVQITCNACHSTVTGDGSSIADYAWHVNQVANVIMNATDFGGSFNGGTCSNVKCHSTDGHSNFVDAQWSGAQGCAYCHGEAKDKATMESEAKLSPAHAAHLGTAAGEYGNSARLANVITCGNCHKGTTDDGSALNAGGLINHVNFANNIVFDISSINSSSGNWMGDVTKTCESNYCHGTNMPFGSNVSIINQGTGMTPDWSDTDYINGTASNDCAQCHGFPPSQYTGYEGTDSTIHDKVGKAVDNCVGCHGHLNKEIDWPSQGQWNNIALHIDGVVQYTSCTGCHGQPPLDATTIISNPEYTLMTAGAHKAHFDNGIGDQTDECDVCHLGGGAAGGHPYSYEITMGFANYVNGGATYQGLSTINSVYNAGSVDANTTVLPVGANRYCNNIYCHSDGGDVAGTYSAKQADWDGGALGCGDCHGNGAQYVITNAHPKHVAGSGTDYSFECRECHFATVDATPDIINPAIHVDFIKNVVFSAGGVTQGGSYTRPTCDSTYCHSDGMGTNVQPVWNSASTGACGTCHGVDGYAVANIPTSAAHQKHLLVSEGYKFECEKCHSGIVTDSADSSDVPSIASTALHVDGFPNAVMNTADPLVGGSATWNDSANECSNVYCHSDGAGTFKTQAWSGSLDCSGCHNAAPATGRHTKHLSAASGYQYECFECHGATVDGANAIIGNHVNVVNDVAWGNISSGSDAYSEPGNTCANVYCHSDGVNTYGEQTADWDDPNSGQCGDCHGVDATTMPASGAHVRHLELATGNNYMYECDKCHYGIVAHTVNSTSAPALLDNSVHVDGVKNAVLDSSDGLVKRGLSVSYDMATGTCTNTYCHGADMPTYGANGGGLDTAPTWGNTSYILGGIPNTDQDCSMCHDTPPKQGAHGSTPAYSTVTGDNCNGCHTHLNQESDWATLGYWKDITKHLNGQPDGGCEGCHGQPPNDGSLIIPPNATGRASSGAHTRHWNYKAGFKNCDYCHSGGGSGEGTSHPDAGTSLELAFGFTYPAAGDNPTAIYNADDLAGSYTITSYIPQTTASEVTGSPRACYNIYCHSDGGNYDKSSYVYQSADWDSPFVSGYPTNCDRCHGDGAGTGNYVLSTMHPKHTGTYGYDCVLCHSTVVNGSMGIISNALHVDGTKQVALYGSDIRTSDGSWTKPDCSLYCHTRGDDNTAPFNAPLNTAQWNASLPTDCTACHGGDATVAVANRIDASRGGAHGKHTNNSAINGENFECVECHIATVSAGDNQQVTGIGNHVDRLVNIKFDNNGVNKDSYGPLYNGNSTTGSAGYGKTPGTALASCENVYCHSDGNPDGLNRVYNTVAWNGTFGGSVCAGCHGNDASEAYPMHGNAGAGAPGSNSHYKHADSSQLGIGCNECHWQTTQDDTSIASATVHIDGDPQNVTFRVGGPNEPGSYDTGLRRCSATYCHGSGQPYWGDTVACGDCHKANGAVAGRHDIHFEVTATNATASDWTASRDSTSLTYEYSCGVCHVESAHSNNTLYEVVLNATYAGTSTSYTAGSSQGADPNTSYDWTNGTCATYCHSDGVSASSNTPNEGVNWATSVGTIGCDGCHGYTVVSPNKIGSGSGSTSHYDHISGTVMSANGCQYCHVSTTSNGTTIADKSLHVNVAKDVGILGTYDGNGGTPEDNYSGGECDNVKCHTDGKTTPLYNSPAWGATIGDCTGCHGGANGSWGYAGSQLSTAHTVHTGTFSYTCNQCHNLVASNNTTISTPANHINLSVQVNMSSGSWGGTNCTGTCHGTTSINWGSSGTKNDCAICHGMSDTGVTGRDTNGDTSAGDLQVGAHVVHLTAANGLTAGGISCGECHTEPSGATYVDKVNAGTHADGGPAEINWGTLADGTVLGGSNTNPNYSQPTCTNVYCHGVTLLGGMDTAPTWTNTTYLDGVDDCKMCHGAPDGTNGFTATNYTHAAGDTGCAGCHNHAGSGSEHMNGELYGMGEPTIKGPCQGCHDEHFKRMNDTTPGTVYKHYMNNVTDTYPIIASGVVTQNSERNCLMCHADHTFFNITISDADSPYRKRESNLRLTIKSAPSSVQTDVVNSGYDWSATDGGICMSCHTNAQTKAITGPHGEPYTLPIPYVDNDYDQQNGIGNSVAPDGSGSEQPGQNAVKIVRNSTHNYAVNMNLFSNSDKTYSAVCLKCHGDTLEKTKQRGSDLTNTLSLHQSSRDSLQAVMGSEPTGFFRGTIAAVASNTITLNETMSEDYSSGFSFVMTDIKNAAGGDPTYVSQRIDIDGATPPSTIYLNYAPNSVYGADDHYEITKTATSIAEVCFNCHSNGPSDPEGYPDDGYKNTDGVDFYGGLDGTVDAGDVTMQQRLEKMYGLFTDFNQGSADAVATTTTTATITDANLTWPADGSNWVGYKLEFTSGTYVGNRYSISSGNGSDQIVIATPSKLNSLKVGDLYKILKPAFHPLDNRGVHNTMEAYTASAGWNYGNVIDAGGTRHVGCTDCHNTHASLSNPTGEGTDLVFTANTLRDPHKTSEATEWQTDRWKGYMILLEVVDSGGANRRRVIRYVTGSTTLPEADASKGTTYTFSTNFLASGAPQNNNAENRYELIWHDGITGSGGKGVWGVMVDTKFTTVGGSTQGTAPVANDFTKKFDTSFDVDLDGAGLRGKQYMQCFRCHTYYAWGATGQIPTTPSGNPDGTTALETDILQEFNVNNYAHHAVLGVGVNQPITPDGTDSLEDPTAFVTVSGVDVYYINQNWPMLSVTTSGISSGAVTLSSGSLPRNALPGWYVMRDSNLGEWYQIVDITDSTHFTIAKTDGNPFDLNKTYPTSSGSQGLTVTAGLGNTFVPPFGPWSVIRCSDCHGSTLSDPVGPHASVNDWLIRDTEVDLSFEWMSDNSGNVSIIDYTNSTDIDGTNYLTDPTHVTNNKKYICFNCHRADVYGTQAGAAGGTDPVKMNQSRINHGGSVTGACNIEYDGATTGSAQSKMTFWPQYCRHCHAGDKMGGIHGTALQSAGNPNWLGAQGYRFLNGSTWNGYGNNDSMGDPGFQCYTQGTGTEVSACTGHSGGGKYVTGLNYQYQ